MKYRGKTVDAVQFLGTRQSCTAVTAFLGGAKANNHGWRKQSIRGGFVDTEVGAAPFHAQDWIVRAANGTLEVMRPAAFAERFEKAAFEPDQTKAASAMGIIGLDIAPVPAPGAPAVA